MMLQSTIQTPEHYRCFVVGGCNVRVVPYLPGAPYQHRYGREEDTPGAVRDRLMRDSAAVCEAFGYDLNMIEFAVQNDVPWAIDLLNPVPNADVHTIGSDHFEWLVENVAQLAIQRAQRSESRGGGARANEFLCMPGSKVAVSA
jgi:hypothetical protein